MTRSARVLIAAAVLAGCWRFRPAPPPETEGDPTRLVAQADELVRTGSIRSARALYRTVLKKHPKSPAAANALWGLGRLYIDPNGSLRDYGSAHVAFSRLAAEHPESLHAEDARAWQAALGELLRAQADLRQLRGDVEKLKELDIEQEREGGR